MSSFFTPSARGSRVSFRSVGIYIKKIILIIIKQTNGWREQYYYCSVCRVPNKPSAGNGYRHARAPSRRTYRHWKRGFLFLQFLTLKRISRKNAFETYALNQHYSTWIMSCHCRSTMIVRNYTIPVGRATQIKSHNSWYVNIDHGYESTLMTFFKTN